MANNIRDLTDATGRRMADALEHLSGSGKSDAKFPHPTYYDLSTMAYFAIDHGHSSSDEILLNATALTISSNPYHGNGVAGSPIHAFLMGLEQLSDYFNGDDGRIAFITYNYMRLLMMEAARYNLSHLLKFTDGVLTQISKCPVTEVPNDMLPAGSAFIILSSKIVKGINDLDAQGLLNNEEAFNALLVENVDGIYFHGNQPLLKTIDVTVTPVAGNKLHFSFAHPRQRITNNFFVITAATAADLPGVTYGTAIDATSTGQWAGSSSLTGSDTPDDQTEFEYTLPSGHTEDTAVHIVELLRNMKPIANRILDFQPIA